MFLFKHQKNFIYKFLKTFQGLKTGILAKRMYIFDTDMFICLKNGIPACFWTELHLMLAMEEDILDAV